MGVGKTSAVKQWLKSLNSKDLGSSPTFSIVNEYLSPTGVIYHFDFYRLNSLNEAEDIGLDEYFSSGRPCWIEWPENIGNLLPENSHHLHIEKQPDDSRKLTLEIYAK